MSKNAKHPKRITLLWVTNVLVFSRNTFISLGALDETCEIMVQLDKSKHYTRKELQHYNRIKHRKLGFHRIPNTHTNTVQKPHISYCFHHGLSHRRGPGPLRR